MLYGKFLCAGLDRQLSSADDIPRGLETCRLRPPLGAARIFLRGLYLLVSAAEFVFFIVGSGVTFRRVSCVVSVSG